MEVIVRKWGNSLGVILPKEMIENQKIKEKDKIHISVIKPVNLTPMFGMMKGKLKMSTQELKNIARSGWDK